jgi:hypothetical protein
MRHDKVLQDEKLLLLVSPRNKITVRDIVSQVSLRRACPDEARIKTKVANPRDSGSAWQTSGMFA